MVFCIVAEQNLSVSCRKKVISMCRWQSAAKDIYTALRPGQKDLRMLGLHHIATHHSHSSLPSTCA